jgi:Holliday junction resolvasome RuvABC endonuclease subunit
MTVIGIDPSSKKLALCITYPGSEKYPEFHSIRLPEGILQATGAAFEEAFLCFRKHPEAAVYMEEPVVGRNVRSTIVQAQVGGAVMAAADRAGLPYFELVNNSHWKKEVLGKGNAKKEEISELLEKIWPEAYNLAQKDQDLIDASCINRYGVRRQKMMQAVMSRRNRATQEDGSEEGTGNRKPGLRAHRGATG